MSERLTAEDLDSLRHMLGATPPASPKSIGLRNYFYTTINDPSMKRLQDHGFVRLGRRANESEAYFYATRLGCEAAGLTNMQTQRALKGMSDPEE